MLCHNIVMLPLKVCFEMQTVTMYSGSIFAGQSLKQTRRLLQTLMEDQGAPSASDASIAWPAPLLRATETPNCQTQFVQQRS